MNFKSSGRPLRASACPKAPAYPLSFPHWLFIHISAPNVDPGIPLHHSRPLSLELPGTTTKLHVRSLKPIDPPNNIFCDLYPSHCIPLRAKALLTVKHSPCSSYYCVLRLEVVSILPEFLIFQLMDAASFGKRKSRVKPCKNFYITYVFVCLFFMCSFRTFTMFCNFQLYLAPTYFPCPPKKNPVPISSSLSLWVGLSCTFF